MRVKHIITGILIIVAILAVHGNAMAEGFVGSIGDRIDYSSGALTLSETDVTIPGRRGLDVQIIRSYTSANYLPDVDLIDNPDTHCVYQRPFDSSSNKYMGIGWHIEYPYLNYDDSATTITYQDGSSEDLLVNLDASTNGTYPRKTRGLAILTDYKGGNPFTEVMLCADGTKLEFGKRYGDCKLMTKMYNRHGDYIEVTYWGNKYIKYVTSPIGRKVHFQYCDEDSVYSLTSSPTNDVRLSNLLWLNHEGDTLRVTYEYDWTKEGLLNKVKHPNGDSTLYTYTTDIYYNDVADYWDTAATWADTLSYNDTQKYDSDDLYYLGSITDPAGAYAEYRYRAFMIPTYSICDYKTFDDPIDEFKNYIGVNRRIADGDTLLIKYELSYPGLEVIEPQMEYAGMVSRVTTVLHPSGGEQEFWYFLDKECGYVPSEWLYPFVFCAGYYPNMLYQKHSIFDGDTVCTGYSYGTSNGGDIVKIGKKIDSEGSTIDLYTPATFVTHVGVPYYHPDLHFDSLSFTATSSKEWRSTILEKDMDAAGVMTRKIESERLDQWLTTDTTCTNKNGYYTDVSWIPSPYPNDTLWFRMDSVLDYTYVSSRNFTLIDKVWSFFQNDSLAFGMFTNFYYNSSKNYVIDSVLVTLDSDYSDDTDTLRTFYEYYSSGGMVKSKTDPNGDKTYWEWDTLYNSFTWKETDSALGDIVTYDYYPNGQLKKETDLNGAVTEYYYDSLGRDLGIKMPLEDSGDTTIINIYESGNVTGNSTKIDDSTRIVTKSVHDDHYRRVKTILEVDTITSIVDSLTYDMAGLIAKQSRPKYADSGSTYWTEYYHDQSTRKVKTVLPDGSKDTIRFIDEFTTLYDDYRGQRTVSGIDLAGNQLFDSVFEVGDTTSLMGVVTYAYDKMGHLRAVTDLEGRTRQQTYDDWGRVKKLIDIDVGTVENWYDEWGDLRLIRYNSDTIWTYFIYDTIAHRLLEAGSVPNADTASLGTRTYPSSGTTVSVTNRYDSYSTSSIATDTTGGLGYCLNRLTEQISYQDGSVVDSTFYYYDARGRVGQKTTWITGLPDRQKLKFEYYANDAPMKITYPDNSTNEYEYFQTGWLSSISGIIGEDSVEYEPWGAIREAKFVNGVVSTNSHDSLSRLIKTINRSSYMKLFCREYSYDNHFIDKEYDLDSTGTRTALGEIRTYAYDSLGRLVSAFMEDPNESADTTTMAYDYDLNGNLNSRWVSDDDSLVYTRFDGSNCDSVIDFSDDSTWVINRNDRGQLTSIETWTDGEAWDDRINYAYDHRGLMTSAEWEADFYQFGDKPDTVLNLYNGDGQKVKQTHIYRFYDSESGPRGSWIRIESDRYYVWAGNTVILEYDDTDSLANINVYGLGQRLQRKDLNDVSADSTCHYINDYHGSVRSYVDSRGIPGDRMIEYYPYGELYSQGGLGHTPHWYIGKEKDKTEELDFGPRY
ncbi:MAG: hypothetical protein OEV80_14515, partial [candidate division Zixibacteria bacterium]|nr:hypothetical protein [candidate division Zixibacteria bacterium]